MSQSVASSAADQTPESASSVSHGPVQIALARSQAELLASFRLLYKSYLRAGLVSENRQQLRLTEFHPLSTTEVLVAKCRDEVVSTMTLVGDGQRGLPLESMYGSEYAQLRRTGLRCAEAGSFADRRTSPTRFKQVFNLLARLLVQAAKARGYDALVAATHPKHARFYVRWLGFKQFGDLKQCTYAEGNPAVALLLDFNAIQGTRFHERLFGEPLTSEDLRPTDWNSRTSRWLQELLTSVEGVGHAGDADHAGAPNPSFAKRRWDDTVLATPRGPAELFTPPFG